MESSSACEHVPAICRTCGNWKPLFFTVIGKDCAVYGTVDWMKDETRCGTWTKRAEPPGAADSGRE